MYPSFLTFIHDELLELLLVCVAEFGEVDVAEVGAAGEGVHGRLYGWCSRYRCCVVSWVCVEFVLSLDLLSVMVVSHAICGEFGRARDWSMGAGWGGED